MVTPQVKTTAGQVRRAATKPAPKSAPKPTGKTVSKATTPAAPSPQAFLAQAEAKISEFSDAFAQASDEARVKAHLGLMELADNWEKTQKNLNLQIARMKRGAQRVRGAIDTVRVRGHLAKADTADAIDELRGKLHHIQQNLSSMVTRGEDQARHALERLERSCQSLSDKLRDS